MTDPYRVLGVEPTASDDEVKRAYRDLVRKYYPDNYQNNPLGRSGQEKMKEVNEANDQITKQRAAGGGSYGGAYQRQQQSYQNTAAILLRRHVYQQVRQAINRATWAGRSSFCGGCTCSEWRMALPDGQYRLPEGVAG